MMKKFICIGCLLLAMFATVWADEGYGDEMAKRYRYAVKGLVVDETGLPLPGVSVRVVGTTFGAGTDSDGKFIIRLENEKSYTLQLSFVGYETKTISTLSAVSPELLQVQLKPSTNQLDEVIVTGSFVERPLKDAPVLTRVISQKEIEAINPMDFESLLQYELPGLQFTYNSMSQVSEISYQGMAGEYMLFLIDGERISGEGADHNIDFSRINVDDIERIEVVKGAQSTIYGSNALGGVINIITKTASRPVSANINLRYAGSSGEKYSASLGIKKNRITSYSSLTMRKRDTYTVSDSEGKTSVTESSDGSVSESTASASSNTVWGYKTWDFTQKVGYTCNEKLSADFKGTYYWSRRAIRSGRLYQDYYVDYTLGGRIKYLPTENQQIIVGYTYDNYKKDNHYFRIDSTSNNYREIKQTPRVDYTGTFGRHTVSAGFEGDIEYLHHYMLPDSAHARTELYSFYAQEDWKITDGLELVVGARADYQEEYDWHFTPKVSVMWNFANYYTLRGGYAHGFRAPTLKELYEEYDMGGLGYFMIYGNPDLEPETSRQYTLSMEYNRGGLNLSVAYAYNRFKNKIDYYSMETTNSSGYNDMIYMNVENAKTSSVEAIARYHFDFGLLLTGSYVYTDDYAEIDGRNNSKVRPHSATFSAQYSHKFKKVGVNCALNGQWASGLDYWSKSTASDGSYSYTKTFYHPRTMCSLNFGATLPRGVAMNFGIENLLNFKDKAGDSSVQTPQKGISCVYTLRLNLADMFKL